MTKRRYNICMVSDFFYPNTGGVESHIFQLSQCLIARGHKVVVITHSYGDRKGVRYMTSGLKAYYIPAPTFHNQSCLPTMLPMLPLFRNILIRESIDIVHGHSAFSTMAHETMMHARAMGLKSVFTDHSLFGFADVSAVVTNNFLQMSLVDCNHCICVSHTSKENTVLRALVKSHLVSVIPNAVDSTMFTPDPTKRKEGRITIVTMSRLVYRKGIDLLALVMPALCQKYSQVDFIVGGDGPKRHVLEETISEFSLETRVRLLGNVEPCNVREVLVQGDIFVNTALTEAFCMAIVEAAACGLQVVTTRVGGIPEVLPPDLLWMCEPNPTALFDAVECAIEARIAGKVVDPFVAHERVARMYQWTDIAERTEKVYHSIASDKPLDLRTRIKRYKSCGFLAGNFFTVLLLICHGVLVLLEWLYPRDSIDICPDLVLKTSEDCLSSPMDSNRKQNL
ncbi:unnamed protein product [Cyprideis torosa]|uniref:phosphatidylinositol N-acetylglucosaminyltransferase n=1 Tax=Cyprideis torosa TaxID=163714 RepID=A0A7R8WDD7_9CRUS|nr:unnamed protein product [Cyprideis torosa]CAG0894504.1 unnamed protein product [Cyprideis torosa]